MQAYKRKSYNLLIYKVKNNNPIFINGFKDLIWKKFSTTYPHWKGKDINKGNSTNLGFTYNLFIFNIKYNIAFYIK